MNQYFKIIFLAFILSGCTSHKENYPNIKDGWYLPSGGNFFYGIQASKTIKKTFDISARLGGTNAQSDNENAILPYYAQLGIMVRF